MSTPADWYPDPTGRYERRYWDGLNWTEHVWAAGVQSVEALAPAPNAAQQVTAEAIASSQATEVRPATAADVPTRKLSRREVKRQGRDAFESTALAAAHGDQTALSDLPAVLAEAQRHYRAKEWDARRWQVLTLGIRDVLDDDLLSEAEGQHLFQLATALGLDLQTLAARDLAAFEELVIAGLNDGRLPTVDVPLMLKAGEVGRATFSVALMKEVAIRQMRGASSGVSVRIAKGVTYRVGQVRARSVVVGTEMQVQDSGVLVVTNQRAVYAGSQRTLEFRFDKLVGMEQFADGLRLNVSNRQLASMFRFAPTSSPAIAAALISRQE